MILRTVSLSQMFVGRLRTELSVPMLSVFLQGGLPSQRCSVSCDIASVAWRGNLAASHLMDDGPTPTRYATEKSRAASCEYYSRGLADTQWTFRDMAAAC